MYVCVCMYICMYVSGLHLGGWGAFAPSRLALAPPLGSETEIIYKCAIARSNVKDYNNQSLSPPYILKTFDSPSLPPFSGFSPVYVCMYVHVRNYVCMCICMYSLHIHILCTTTQWFTRWYTLLANGLMYQENKTADIKWIQYESLNDTMNNIRSNPNRTQAVCYIC